ncbi:D-sedoheptulose-7-phosphate isomerase [Agromyces salentinus]|uniref:SIS domain-containing protein n=1 Tax=Agromyces salentinus TaxID=269421 RepID=A0ABP4Z7D5_9MICO|nr:SIS domain-containing protein [Agromyces salentinus]
MTMHATPTRSVTLEWAARAVSAHVGGVGAVLAALDAEAPRLAAWAIHLAAQLEAGGRLLIAGNGGSAAEAQHLSAEFVGRFGHDRRPYAAIALNCDSSAVTAIGNDYGFDEVFARQVRAHAHPGDIVLLLSTSGASANLVTAARAAAECGATSWAITGPAPNPLASTCDDAITLPGSSPNVQEVELVAVHALCVAFDALVGTEEDVER